MTRDGDLLASMGTQIAAWESVGDQRAVFLACYLRMTDNMILGVSNGRFRDPTWIADLIHNFAGYYFTALEAYDCAAVDLPVVWQYAFDLAKDPKTPVITHLLLGINAHINYDLVHVLADMLEPEWSDLSPAGRRLRFDDHAMVNVVIGETIDRVQDEVVAPYARLMQFVDLAAGPLDEWCTARLIRNWRADVWSQAITIVNTPDLPTRLTLRRETDAIALSRVRLMLDGGALGARAFGYPLRWLRRLRMF